METGCLKLYQAVVETKYNDENSADDTGLACEVLQVSLRYHFRVCWAVCGIFCIKNVS